MKTRAVQPTVLTVNGGSSSIKFALFEANEAMRRILAGRIEGVGLPQGRFVVKGLKKADNFSRPVIVPDHTAAVNVLMDWIAGENRTRRAGRGGASRGAWRPEVLGTATHHAGDD